MSHATGDGHARHSSCKDMPRWFPKFLTNEGLEHLRFEVSNEKSAADVVKSLFMADPISGCPNSPQAPPHIKRVPGFDENFDFNYSLILRPPISLLPAIFRRPGVSATFIAIITQYRIFLSRDKQISRHAVAMSAVAPRLITYILSQNAPQRWVERGLKESRRQNRTNRDGLEVRLKRPREGLRLRLHEQPFLLTESLFKLLNGLKERLERGEERSVSFHAFQASDGDVMIFPGLFESTTARHGSKPRQRPRVESPSQGFIARSRENISSARGFRDVDAIVG
ncbi:hypothetical protein K491DRAFT_685102 [Lophiostoma macrostomum CBS 122681]|uniref:Uncharacterized protein n=1 Tax=Lophiostoma macrostomum CBS 122681 TaxID=1314788 RepID=A0A6A6SLT0_9PLEO|nr:hypothetical protein K491DRAFT_685102 [Lophiostoma macrostomum CBS 122681]